MLARGGLDPKKHLVLTRGLSLPILPPRHPCSAVTSLESACLIFLSFQKSHAVMLGVPDNKASFLVGILSIASTIGKVLAGKIADLKQVNIFYMYQTGLLTMSISTTLLPIANGYPELVLYALVFGLGEACFVVLIPLITKEVVGIKRLSPALGSVFMIMAIPTMLGSPLAGKLLLLLLSLLIRFIMFFREA